MRNKTLFVLILLVSFILSCKKEEYRTVGYARADLNNRPWSGFVHASNYLNGWYKGFYNINIEEDHKVVNHKISPVCLEVNFGHIPKRQCVFQIVNDTNILLPDDSLKVSSYSDIFDIDVIYAWYSLLESDSLYNYFIITHFDQITNEIEGIFSATYVIDFINFTNYPDTLRFRNGYFKSKVTNQ
jgi:hypothetical protein